MTTAAPSAPLAAASAEPRLVETPLLPSGFVVPESRWTNPSTRMRRLLETEPYLFGPGVYDPMGAQLAMYHGYKAVYFSGYSFAIGHLGTTDMDLYSSVEIADAARRTVSAMRKFQLTQAVGDPEKGVEPRHLEIPPLIVDMDGGYGNIFNVQRTTELYVQAGVAAAHIEDQVLPKRCGHIGGKALIPAAEMVGKLRMARAVASDMGNDDFVIIARTDGLSAVDAPESARGLDLAVERALRYLDTGIPDLVWCEFPTSDREPVESFASARERALPRRPLRVQLVLVVQVVQRPVTHHLRRAGRAGLQVPVHHAGRAARHRPRAEPAADRHARRSGAGLHRPAAARVGGRAPTCRPAPTTSSAAFPYHHLMGRAYDAARLGTEFAEALPEDRVV